MNINPETRKILVYGSVSIVAGVAVLYLWNKYGNYQNNTQQSNTDAASAANAQATQQAAQAEADYADLALLSGGSSVNFGGGLSATTVQPYEAPADNFASEISSILQAAGVQSGNPSNPAQTSTPGTPATQRTAPHVIHIAPVVSSNNSDSETLQ